jgi:hypothetical protein
VNVSALEERFSAGDEVTPETLRAAGLAKRRHPVKVLARGELTKKLTIKAHAFSATARDKIEKAGGTCELIDQDSEPAAKTAQGGRDGASGEAAKQASEPAGTDASQPGDTGAEGEDVDGGVR